MKLTIIGGGGLGHVCAAVASSQQHCAVSMLTGHPQRWNDSVSAVDPDGKIFAGRLDKISSNVSDVIPGADVVLLCLPGYLIEQTIQRIAPFLDNGTAVGSIVSSTGFFMFAHRNLPASVPLFGFQRVPFISRVKEYGHSSLLLGYKKELALAVENHSDPELLRAQMEKLFLTPTKLLASFYEAALTNSNPILHTGRLFSMWHDWDGTPYDHQILFYREWDVASAQKLIDMDSEFMALLSRLPVREGVVPSLLDYYESHDAISLAEKIKSIASFQTITAPMKQIDGGWVPDFDSRYFTEDFPFGLKLIKDLAVENNIATPNIDMVLEWGMSKLMAH
ncbi:MAG: NAD/NADP octopine/nopaline dehydrogenase family protein [Bacteroidales bacterium]|nr:NAD/NADP octopine/nopaline dehydrogenase family protein [Bacteroidales bacterium]